MRLHWRRAGFEGAPGFTLTWEERGGPPVVAKPYHSGFGSKLVERLVAAELNGTAKLEFAPSGLVYTLSAPCPPE